MSDYLIWATEKIIRELCPEEYWDDEYILDVISQFCQDYPLADKYSIKAYLKEVGR